MDSVVPFWNQLPEHAHNAFLRIEPNYNRTWFDHLSEERRLTVLTLYVKLSGLKFWPHIMELADVAPGRLHFHCCNTDALKAELTRRTDFVSPAASKEDWSSAEMRAVGSLHFKHFPGWPENKVQAHIDHFWGWTTVPHWFTYSSYKDPFRARAILLEQGWDRAALLGIGVWHCGARDCRTHGEPQHRCQPGVWYCGRVQPACPGHSSGEHRCATGSKWHCGERNCGCHALPLPPCRSGVWYCGQVKPPCAGHSRREDRCATGAALLLFARSALRSAR
jgi:hypothetical protein